jgi:hypothetical protein
MRDRDILTQLFAIGNWNTPGFIIWSTVLHHQLSPETIKKRSFQHATSLSAVDDDGKGNDQSIYTLVLLDADANGLQYYAMSGNVHKRVNDILSNVVMIPRPPLSPLLTSSPTIQWTTPLINNNDGYQWIHYKGAPDYSTGRRLPACRYRQ